MDITQLILEVLLVILGLYLAFFKSYFGKKGKNLATKEDVSEITEKIEAIKNNYASSLESVKAQLQVQSSLRAAFQSKCLEAVVAVDRLLVEITLYCWRELAKRTPNEHYVWSAVDESDDKKGFHYFRVAIDKATLVHGLYLTENAKQALSKLSDKIGLLSSMELALMVDDPHPAVEASAESGYGSALKAVDECKTSLMRELGIQNDIEKEKS